MSQNTKNMGDSMETHSPKERFSSARFARNFVGQPDEFLPVHMMPKSVAAPESQVEDEPYNGPTYHPDDSDYDEDCLSSPLMSPARSIDDGDCTTTMRGKILPGTDFDTHLVFPPKPTINEQVINRGLQYKAAALKRAAEDELAAAPMRGDKLWLGFYTGLELRDIEKMQELGERRELTLDERKRKEEMKKLHKRTCKGPLREKRKYEWKSEMKNKSHVGGPKKPGQNKTSKSGRGSQEEDLAYDERDGGLMGLDSQGGPSKQNSALRRDNEDDHERAAETEGSAGPSSRSNMHSRAPSPAGANEDEDKHMNMDTDSEEEDIVIRGRQRRR